MMSTSVAMLEHPVQKVLPLLECALRPGEWNRRTHGFSDAVHTRVDGGGTLPTGCLSFSISLVDRINVSLVSGIRSSN